MRSHYLKCGMINNCVKCIKPLYIHIYFLQILPLFPIFSAFSSYAYHASLRTSMWVFFNMCTIRFIRIYASAVRVSADKHKLYLIGWKMHVALQHNPIFPQRIQFISYSSFDFSNDSVVLYYFLPKVYVTLRVFF